MDMTVQTCTLERAVAVWLKRVDILIAQVKFNVYHEAVKYLRKAGSVMAQQKKEDQ